MAYASDKILKNLIGDIVKGYYYFLKLSLIKLYNLELYLYIDYCCKDMIEKEFKQHI